MREVRSFPADPQEGEPIAFQLAGDMTVKETTQEVVWETTATLEGDRLSGTATLETTLESFNIPVPSIANILRVTDGITLTLDFVMARAAELARGEATAVDGTPTEDEAGADTATDAKQAGN